MFSLVFNHLTTIKSHFKKGSSIATTSFFCDESKRLPNETYKVNNFEKRMLVWMGKYKSIEEVPGYVKPETMEKVRSRLRVRISNYSIVLTLAGCLLMIYMGKQARERGDTLHKRNLEWHDQHKTDK